MRSKYTREEYERISCLVECAISARNKAEAKKYSSQLDYITFDVGGYSRGVLSELKAATIAASGSVRNKDKLVETAHWYLSKFEMQCVECNYTSNSAC